MNRQETCGRRSVIEHNDDPASHPMIRASSEVVDHHSNGSMPSDQRLIEIWLHGRPEQTRRAYQVDVIQMLAWVGCPIAEVTLTDLQGYADHLGELGLSAASRHRKLSSVKSLYAFAHQLGYLPFDVARALRLESLPNQLSERILSEAEVRRMILMEPSDRNQVILIMLYATGVRVSELCGIRMRDCHPRNDGSGQVTVHGKGGKTRSIQLPACLWQRLPIQADGDQGDQPLFTSKRGTGISTSQVRRVVSKAAERAGIDRSVSPHWLRHAHASHALDRQAPIHLVQQTLGHSNLATTGRYLHARPTDSSANYLSI